MPTIRIKAALIAFFLATTSQLSFSATPGTIFLQWTFGLSMWDDTINTNELKFNGPSVDKTVGFVNDYSFTYDDRGLSTTTLTQQTDPYQWYVRGALVLTSLTYATQDGQEKHCSSYEHFHMTECPNVVGWFNNFAMPQDIGETVVLVSMADIAAHASSVPEPSQTALFAAGITLLCVCGRRKIGAAA